MKNKKKPAPLATGWVRTRAHPWFLKEGEKKYKCLETQDTPPPPLKKQYISKYAPVLAMDSPVFMTSIGSAIYLYIVSGVLLGIRIIKAEF